VSLGALGAAAASFAVLAAMFVPLERMFPARPGQPVLRAEWGLDLLFFLGQYLVFTGLAITALDAVGHLLQAHLPQGMRSWGLRASPVLACIAAVVGGDLLVYWFHRACHEWPLLWRFHAVHHSTAKLDWLAAHREHPVDGVLTQLCQNLPAIALGIPVRWLAALAVFRGVWAIFVHSNVRLPLGPLRWVLGAPELHHWHHAKLDRTRHNFANLAPWIDWLFGTHHMPAGAETYELGVEEAEASPPGAGPLRAYATHLVRPLIPSRRMNRPRAVLASAAIAVANLGVTRDAHALDAVDIEIAAKAGFATNPSSIPNLNPPNPLGFGLGGRAGLAFKGGLYLGGNLMDYFTGSQSETNVTCGGTNACAPISASASIHVLMYGAEMGYGIKLFDLLTVRPQLGFGNAAFSESGSPSTTIWYLEPGVTGLVDLGHLILGADVNMLVFPNTNYDQGALSLHAQVGVKF